MKKICRTFAVLIIIVILSKPCFAQGIDGQNDSAAIAGDINQSNNESAKLFNDNAQTDNSQGTQEFGISGDTPVSDFIGYDPDSQLANVKPQMGLSLARFMMSFLGVICLIIFCFYMFRVFYSDKKLSDAKGNKIIEIIERMYLGPKRSIVLIRVANKLMAVGLDEKINLLSIIDDSESIAMIESAETRKQRKFSRFLNNSHDELKKNTQNAKEAVAV